MAALHDRIAALEAEQKRQGMALPALVLIEGVSGFTGDQLDRAAAAMKAGVMVVYIERKDMRRSVVAA